ncbi:MAG: fused MFS/spermidine synthase [Bacteriovoracaceae bacterium]|jgi:hypothetical protein|nr:fused MFS/spermidine synthase [Bacteriovoracaceae bacterium]
MNQFSITVLLGAFLLFQLELIMAKKLLPIFGGSFTVWTTCMLFFTSMIFFSYFATNIISKKINQKKYAIAHIFLLIVATAFFPFNISENVQLQRPIVSILTTLFVSMGLPFFLLGMTNPLLQDWFHKIQDKESHFLFSASNIGSLLGLLSYPLLIAPLLSLNQQINLWCTGYVFYIIGIITCRPKKSLEVIEVKEEPIPFRSKLYWVLLSATGLALMLAITNIITAEMGSIPLLWTIPLVIYLLTFILNFKQVPFYPASLRKIARMLIFGLAVILLVLENKGTSLLFLALQYLILFFGCMFCHRKLYLDRPKSGELTSFYLYLSLGGGIGSLFMSVGIPILGKDWGNTSLEYLVALALFASALLVKEFEQIKLTFSKQALASVIIASLLIVCGIIGTKVLLKDQSPVLSFRNFYGPYRIVDSNGIRKFFHGATLHGQQFLDKERSKEPLLYFHPQSPIGEFFATQTQIESVGVLGMGIGSLTAYARKGQHWDIYEIDPDVVAVAQSHFTHLKQGLVRPTIHIGDGRLNLQSKQDKSFDLLIMDAFSSDSVPTHLITLEAMRLYLKKLKNDGVLIFNISNRYLNLNKILLSAAIKLNIPHLTQLKKFSDKRLGKSHSSWFLMSKNQKIIDQLKSKKSWTTMDPKKNKIRVWTDSYTNVLAAFKFF